MKSEFVTVDGTGIKICVVLDGASRMAPAGGEFSATNTENGKLIIDQLSPGKIRY